MMTNRIATRYRFVVLLVLVVGVACGGSTPSSPSELSGAAGPQTFYVSTTGNDRNGGSIAEPWKTLRFALGRMRAGDTLYLRGGTYTGADNTIDSEIGTVPSGTSWSNPVVIGGYAGELVTIRPPGGMHGVRLTAGSPHYVIVQDLTIDMGNQVSNPDSSPNGVYVSSGANHNRFLRLDIKNAISFGLVFSPNNRNSPFNEVIDCRIHDNGFTGGDSRNGHGMYIATSDNLIEGNEVYDNRGFGIHFYNNAGPKLVARNIARNNRIHGNGSNGGSIYGIAVAYGEANVITRNEIYDNPGGILVYTGSDQAELSNNTIRTNRPLEGIMIQYATATIVRDNILYENGTDILDLGTTSVLAGNRRSP
jgi:parallel beta-helix repeat protein